MSKKRILLFILIIFMIGIGFCGYAHYLITKTAEEKTPGDIPYVIVLGARVNGSELSLSLLYRMQTSLQYLQAYPDSQVIVTGGKGTGEDITEAEAMKQYLLENGITESRILLEDQSTSTYENLTFTKELFGVEEAVIVSNDFHLYRAIQNAESLGITAFPLAAETPAIVKWKLYIREYAAILKLKLTGK